MSTEHRVEDYFAGVLEAEERAQFERHIDQCATCKSELDELRQLDARLSRELTLPAEERQPRQEWIDQVKAGLPPQGDRRVGWVIFGGLPAAAAAIVIVLLIVFQPWKTTLAPEDSLARAYDATLNQAFRGAISISDGTEVVATGVFRHQPDGRWAVVLQLSSGQTVEEVQVGNRRWQRKSADGPWDLLTPGKPLLMLPRGVGALDQLAHVLESVTVLSSVEVLQSGEFEGVDRDYAVRLIRDVPAGVDAAPSPWLTQHPPLVFVSLTREGTIQHLRMVIEAPGEGRPVSIDLQFQDYGIETQIEPPQS